MSTFDDPNATFDDPIVNFDEGAIGTFPVSRFRKPSQFFSTIDAQRLQTDALISFYGKSIILHRPPPYVDDGAGGLIRQPGEPTMLPPQRFYFENAAPIAHVARNASFTQPSGEGQQVVTNYVLVGYPGANVQQDDVIKIGSKEYKVVYVDPDQRYQVKAEVELVTSP